MNTHSLIRAVEDVMTQGLEVLSLVADDGTYRYVLPAPYSASVGQHYRHVIDHFTCLMRGLLTGVIDYDNRPRELRVEISIDEARYATASLIAYVGALTTTEIEASCAVLYSVGYREEKPIVIETVVAREIAFCVSHAVHHFAIVRLVCDELALALPAEIGVAPSTLKHRAISA